MGVDARMLVKPAKEITEDERRKASYLFGQAFRGDLSLGWGETIYYKPLNWLRDQAPEELDEAEAHVLAVCPWALHVPVGGRYYGLGYARGPIMTYVSMAEFLERLLPGCTIYYGGDSGPGADQLFDRETREAYMQFFIENGGHTSYWAYKDTQAGRVCPVCEVAMSQTGFGQAWELYTCAGCGWKHEMRDGLLVMRGFER